MLARLWCNTDHSKQGGQVCNGWRMMPLFPATVKDVPNIPAYVCPVCNVPKWLPGTSIAAFLSGLNR